MHIRACIYVSMLICTYINTYNRVTDFIYAGINKTELHVTLWIPLYHIIDTVKQNINIVSQWTQKFSVDYQEVPACCGYTRPICFHISTDKWLVQKLPNHVSICLSLQDIRNMNFSLLSRCINVGSLELILVWSYTSLGLMLFVVKTTWNKSYSILFYSVLVNKGLVEIKGTMVIILMIMMKMMMMIMTIIVTNDDRVMLIQC